MASRKYSPIWEQLKSTGRCVIAAPVPLQPRFIKGVLTEKNKDIAFKLLQSEEGKKSVINYSTEGAKVSFKLKTFKDVTVEDL